MKIEEWKELTVPELKRLIKGRSGRKTELEIEIEILKSLMKKKVDSGDFGTEKPRKVKEIKQKIGTAKPTEKSNLQELDL